MNTQIAHNIVTFPGQAARLEACLAEFGAPGRVVERLVGPLVETYHVRPGPGIRVAKLLGLEADIALRLGTDAVRVETGDGVVAVEVPREKAATVAFRRPHRRAGAMPVYLGESTTGEPVTVDLADAPHLLVAGATGAGKSVAMHAMICSVTDQDVRLLLIDPKMLEFNVYAGHPKLGHPVVTEAEAAVECLEHMGQGMDERYRELARYGYRDIGAINAAGARWPRWLVVIDEWADLFLTAGKDVERPLVRLAQKARAAGIHIVLGTQRPSVKVLSGVIKANFPARLALRTASAVDSRVILDSSGAEQLLGRGDSLLSGFGHPKPVRVHGAFCQPENWL